MEKEHTSVVVVDELLFHSIRHTKQHGILAKNMPLPSYQGLMLQPQNIKLNLQT